MPPPLEAGPRFPRRKLMVSPQRKRSPFLPTLEPLSERIVPTGVIKTSFSSGVLTITGQDTGQDIALLGASQGHISISAQDGETFQGRNSFNFVSTVVLNMNGGNDIVTLVDLKLARS